MWYHSIALDELYRISYFLSNSCVKHQTYAPETEILTCFDDVITLRVVVGFQSFRHFWKALVMGFSAVYCNRGHVLSFEIYTQLKSRISQIALLWGNGLSSVLDFESKCSDVVLSHYRAFNDVKP